MITATIKFIIVFALGAFFGAYLVPKNQSVESVDRSINHKIPDKQESDSSELDDKEVTYTLKEPPPLSVNQDSDFSQSYSSDKKDNNTDNSVELKVSALNKVIGLTPDEEYEVRELFSSKNYSQSELKNIIGEDRLKFYLDQQRQSFSRVEQEDLERDLYFYSRKFSLSPEQESGLMLLLTDVKNQIKIIYQDNPPKTGQDRLSKALAEASLYRATLKEGLKTLLSPDQYQAYLLYEAESTAAEMELWHNKE